MAVVPVLKSHQEDWSRKFEDEAAAVREAVGREALAIHHIGSTAIPGILAKPIIDMLVEVASLEGLDRHAASLEALGYECLGEFGIPGRRYFRKDDARGVRTHQIHAFASGSPHLRRHLAFRDYLRAFPEVAHDYSELKRGLAASCGGNLDAYIAGKDPFIKAVEQDALRWAG